MCRRPLMWLVRAFQGGQMNENPYVRTYEASALRLAASPSHPCSRGCRLLHLVRFPSRLVLPDTTGDFRHWCSVAARWEGMAPNPARRKALALQNHLGSLCRCVISEQYWAQGTCPTEPFEIVVRVTLILNSVGASVLR